MDQKVIEYELFMVLRRGKSNEGIIYPPGISGQFKHLIPALIARGDEVSALVPIKQSDMIEGVNYFLYKLERGNTKNIHPLILETESKVIRGELHKRQLKNLELFYLRYYNMPSWMG